MTFSGVVVGISSALHRRAICLRYSSWSCPVSQRKKLALFIHTLGAGVSGEEFLGYISLYLGPVRYALKLGIPSFSSFPRPWLWPTPNPKQKRSMTNITNLNVVKPVCFYTKKNRQKPSFFMCLVFLSVLAT